MLFVGAADKLADRGMAKSGVGMHYAFVDCLPHCLSDYPPRIIRKSACRVGSDGG